MPDVEDKADDHKDPSPTAHSAANRAVGKDVEQGRIGKDDQPGERNEEAVECTVHQVRENPDQRESDSWREPGKQCEQTPHSPTFLSGPRCEPGHKTLWTAGERANARQAHDRRNSFVLLTGQENSGHRGLAREVFMCASLHLMRQLATPTSLTFVHGQTSTVLPACNPKTNPSS